jgi:uridine kinase
VTDVSRFEIEPGAVVLATNLVELLLEDFDLRRRHRPVIGIAGESGSGKSTTAAALSRELGARGIPAGIIHQDDYFIRPPRTNHEHRVHDLSSVGAHEVDMALLATHVAAFRDGRTDVPVPRVDYPANCFVTEHVDFSPLRALVVEGTYVLQLDAIDVGIFHDATHADTLERRRARNRDIDAPIMDHILRIEHAIISPQAQVAHVLVDRSFAIRRRR